MEVRLSRWLGNGKSEAKKKRIRNGNRIAGELSHEMTMEFDSGLRGVLVQVPTSTQSAGTNEVNCGYSLLIHTFLSTSC